MPHPFLNFLVPPLICIGISSWRWSNFTIIDSPVCCLFVCHVLLLLFLCFFFFSLFLRRQFFAVVFFIVRRCCFSEGRKHMTLGYWQILDYFISCSYTLHHSWGDPCASWRSRISFKGATSRAVQKCCFDISDASILHLYE